MKINDLYSYDYVTKEDIRKCIPGEDFKSRKRRSDEYKKFKGRLCERVDLTVESQVFTEKDGNWREKTKNIVCLRNTETDDIIFTLNNKTVFIITTINGLSVLKGRVKTKFKTIDKSRKFNMLMTWCLCRMLYYIHGC